MDLLIAEDKGFFKQQGLNVKVDNLTSGVPVVQGGKLVVTPLGKSMPSDERQRSLLAILFHIMFWRMDFEYFGRGLLSSWPQADIGIVLWSLSVSAADWQTTDKLTRLCTIPEPA